MLVRADTRALAFGGRCSEMELLEVLAWMSLEYLAGSLRSMPPLLLSRRMGPGGGVQIRVDAAVAGGSLERSAQALGAYVAVRGAHGGLAINVGQLHGAVGGLGIQAAAQRLDMNGSVGGAQASRTGAIEDADGPVA